MRLVLIDIQVHGYGRRENVPQSVLPDSDGEDEYDDIHASDDQDSFCGELMYNQEEREKLWEDADAKSDTWDRDGSDVELEHLPEDLNPDLPVKSKFAVDEEEPMLIYDVRMAMPRSTVSEPPLQL